MRARADEVEIVDHVVAIVAAEPGALRQDGFEAEGAAHMGVQIGREISRGVVELGHDPIMDVGDQPLADLVEHALFELLAHFFPIDRQLAHMGDRNQRVERAHPFGRHGRIGHAGVVEIDREIGRQHAAAIDIVKQPLIARAEQDHVVRNARPGAFQAEMHHE